MGIDIERLAYETLAGLGLITIERSAQIATMLAAIATCAHIRVPGPQQTPFIDSPAPRKVCRAGRRGGKTTGIAIYHARRFLQGRRQLYTAPTEEQVETFWSEIKLAFEEPFQRGLLYKNETRKLIEIPGTKIRIRAKTAWNADTMRGDYADDLTLDEYQLMDEEAWSVVGAPMLIDNNGNATFIYTPPSTRSRSVSKARDPQHAAKLFKTALADQTGRWATFHWTSHDNPFIAVQGLSDITADMKPIDYRREIMAEEVDEVPGALWKRAWIENNRVVQAPALIKIIIGVDPSGTADGDEIGIVVAGVDAAARYYVLADGSLHGTPEQWARRVVELYQEWSADLIVAEGNFGGEMVRDVITARGDNIAVRLITASRGKAVRADPVSVRYENNQVHHAGTFAALEDEYCTWMPGGKSPNRLDAAVWALTALAVRKLTIDMF